MQQWKIAHSKKAGAGLSAQAAGMLELHHEDEVRPAEVTGGDFDARAVLGAGGAGLEAVHAVEELLGRRAAPAVAAANEGEF